GLHPEPGVRRRAERDDLPPQFPAARRRRQRGLFLGLGGAVQRRDRLAGAHGLQRPGFHRRGEFGRHPRLGGGGGFPLQRRAAGQRQQRRGEEKGWGGQAHRGHSHHHAWDDNPPPLPPQPPLSRP